MFVVINIVKKKISRKKGEKLMSSLIFKEFEEFGRIPKTEDVAYQVTKDIYGLDFANTFMKKGGAKDLTNLQRKTINDATRQELISLHCKKLGSKDYRFLVNFNSIGLPHENVNAFEFRYLEGLDNLNLDKRRFTSVDHTAKCFYLMDDLETIWKEVYKDKLTSGWQDKETEVLLSLVKFLVNQVRTGLSDEYNQNEAKFEKGLNKSFHPFYEKITRQIISILFEQHKKYYKRYLSDIQIMELFGNHRFTKVNSTLGIIEISKLIGNYSTLHGGRPREVFKILTDLNSQDVRTRNPMDLSQTQSNILHKMEKTI